MQRSDIDQEVLDFLDQSVKEIDREDLEGEMRKIAAQLAFANARTTDAYERYLCEKLRFERVEAAADMQIRAKLVAAGDKPTEKKIAALVLLDETYVDARYCLIAAEVDVERLKGYGRALVAKKEMLVSIGMRVNAELRGDPIAAAQARAVRGV